MFSTLMENFPEFFKFKIVLLEDSAIFVKFEIVVCKLFKFGSIKNLSFGKELRRE